MDEILNLIESVSENFPSYSCMTTRVIALWRVNVMSLTTSMSTMRLLIHTIFILKATKPHFVGDMINRILNS